MEFNKQKVRMDYLYRKEKKTKWVPLEQVAQDVRNGKYERLVKGTRGFEAVMTGGGMAVLSAAAEELPRIWPACGENEAYTGLVLLSFRLENDLELLLKLQRRVGEMPQTVLAMVGSSGCSLKVVMGYRLADGTLPVGDDDVKRFQQYAFRRAADFLLATTGMKVEDDERWGAGWFRMSADADVCWNAKAEAVRMPLPAAPLTEFSAPLLSAGNEPPLQKEVLPGYSRHEMDVTKYNMVCRRLSFEAEKETADYLLALADECRQAGIDQEVAVKCTLRLGALRERETLVRSSFENAYNGHRLGRRNPLEPTLMHQELMRAFLLRRYHFRRNTVTGDVEYQEKGRYLLSWHPLTQVVRNDINNAAISEGIKVWPQDMDRLLGSSEIREYDPVSEWLLGLPVWDGRDRLGELADRVPTRAECWREDFKVWMRSMVSQWMGRSQMYGAQMVLMLMGGQGTRKSTFIRLLLPPELHPYYIDRIDFANQKEALRALGRFLLINIDEYDQVTKRQTAFLKHLIQRTDVKERKMYETTYEQRQRYAAFCATTNCQQPLKDETGARRYLVVEVNGVIDTDTTGERAIDYGQLYAQAVAEVQRGADCYFDGERERRIVERNADYYEMPTAVQLFEDLFRRPEAGDEPLWLTPTEVLQQIRERRRLNVVNQSNATLIGSYLKRNGFRKGSGVHYRQYEVSLKS